MDYAQVKEQSGFNIGKSSHISVTENTYLKGGVINAEGDQANHQMQTGTLTTENIENRSEIKVSSLSGGISTDMSQLATSAIGAALSGLGNINESDRSQTQSAISQNIDLQITDNEAQKQKTGKTAEETLQSLNRNTANANQKLEKPDLQALQERQEATQIVAEMGAKAVGDLAKQMKWEEGSPQKVALHGLVGYLSAKVGRGNTTASMLSGMGSEYINSEIANYLQENTALTADERNAIQQASSAGLGALIGAGLGGDSNVVKQSAQMALRTEKFNRQLHPDEKQRIKDLAKGDKEKEARLTVAGCALVRCSAQIPKDEPDYAEAYAKAKAMEDLGNSAEFANERALLSTQFADYNLLDSVSGYRRQLFQYNRTQAGLDKLNRVDTKYGVTTRVSGLAQATGGVATTVFGVGLCESGIGCVASVPVAAYGVDNVVAGARTVYSGKNQPTFGAKALADLTGINSHTAELIYGIPTMTSGSLSLAKGAGKVANATGKQMAESAVATKYVLGELGKDSKAGLEYVNAVSQRRYVTMLNTARNTLEKGLEATVKETRNLNNAIENTGTKKFGLGVAGGGIGELAVESHSYFEGKKEVTPTNLIGAANNVLKSGLIGGITANANTAQALGINAFSSIALKGANVTDSIKESGISSVISSVWGKYNIPEPYLGLYNSYTTEYIQSILKKYEENKEGK